MLKGRGKVFAPKKVVRKPQGSAPSSARPSVERSSQTPAPQPAQETIPTIAEEATVPESAVESNAPHAQPARTYIPSQEDQDQAVASVSQDGGNTARPELKRKEREDGIAPPPPKRVSTATEKPSAPSITIDTPIIEISSQENTPQPESNPAPVASKSQAPSISKLFSQTQAVSKPATRPKIIPPKQKKAVEATTPQSAARASPEARRQDGQSAVPQPVQFTAMEPSSPSSEADNSVPMPTPHPTASTQSDPEPPMTTIPEAPIQTTEEEPPASPSLERSPEPPRHRYPSPQNIVRLADESSAESRGMGRAGGGGVGIGTGEISLRPGEVNQASEIVPIGALNPDGTSGAIQVDEAPSATESATEKGREKPKRKYTKRKKVQPPGDGEDARTTLGMQLNRPRRVAGGKRKGKKKDGTRGRKERAETPDGASDEEIDQSTLTMTDLCRDLRIGKKFSRHKEIKDRVIANKKLNLKKKMIMNNPEIDGLVGDGPAEGAAVASGSGSGPPAPAPPTDRESTPEIAPGAGGGPQIRLVNGELVVDEASLQIDRQARARLNAIDMEEVIEDDFTRVITSGTYMKREKSMLWDHAATIRFYEGLAQFGTDFEMIAKLFPHRNRRQIKLKFNKEERAHPDRVTKAMVGPKKRAIDLSTFERLADEKLEDVAAIEAEYEKYENEMLAKEKEEMDAAAEITRQKKAAIQGTARAILATVDSDEEGDGEGGSRGVDSGSAKENNSQRKRGQKKKNRHSHYAGGEKVTVLETLDY